MRIFFRICFIILFSGIVASVAAYYFWYKPKFKQHDPSSEVSIKKSSEEFRRLKARASPLKKYCAAHHYNSKICFLVDMKIASGKKRFFVYDLQTDSILIAGLVAHGSCDNGFQIEPKFSNKENSGCSCLGKFKIGESYNGRFGMAYKLYGLDSSNANAFVRSIVLHSYNCVPDQETYPLPVCNSRGCAMVSPHFLEKLESYLNATDKSILLGIFK
jgi:L,D-transpeptidase catalytic domain